MKKDKKKDKKDIRHSSYTLKGLSNKQQLFFYFIGTVSTVYKCHFSSPLPAFQTQVPKLHSFMHVPQSHEIPKKGKTQPCGTCTECRDLLLTTV